MNDLLNSISKPKNIGELYYKILEIISIQLLKRICLTILKFVQTYNNLSLNKIRFLLSIDFEKEIENVFKLLNTDDIAKLLEKNT